MLNYFFFICFLKDFIGVEPINSVVIVSGAQQSDSATHIRVPILPQTPLPSRLPHNIEQSSVGLLLPATSSWRWITFATEKINPSI